MSLKNKKFISLFLVFSLIMLSVNLYAKERRGATLIIWKKDGGQIKGELIVVKIKPNSLLLLDTEGKDVSVDIADIRVITIEKKSKALLGAGIGLGAGALLGAILFNYIWHAAHEEYDGAGILLIDMPVGGAIGATLGALIGARAGKDKTIQIEGMTDSEIKETLNKLREKARLRYYG
ncbi:MAG: hypothetical protein GTN73_09090 [Candidatus Aminicenantes bacterium]|nr:hypothetical protein [Candidatus Aminicenantes bacterium]